MAYIGNTPAENYVSIAAQHFTVSATTSYSLNRSVTNENELALFINNVRQQPGSSYSYTATGTTLTLSVATLATDTMYCVFLGKSVGTIVPPDGSVGTSTLATGAVTADKIADGTVVAAEIADGAVTDAKISAVATTKLTGTVTDAQIAAVAASKLTGTITPSADTVTSAQIADDAINSEHYVDGSIDTAHIADNQITLAKMASGTDGQILTYDASGNPVTVGPGTDGQVLTSTGAGSPPAFEDAGGGMHTQIGNTITATNVASVDFTSGIDSTYQSYLIKITNGSVSINATEIFMRVGTGATPTWQTGSVYEWHLQRMQGSSSAEAHGQATGATKMSLTDSGIGNTGVDSWHFNIYIFNPSSTAAHTMIMTDGMAYAYQNYAHRHHSGGAYKAATPVTAFRFYPGASGSAGNISGTFKLYGIS